MGCRVSRVAVGDRKAHQPHETSDTNDKLVHVFLNYMKLKKKFYQQIGLKSLSFKLMVDTLRAWKTENTALKR